MSRRGLALGAAELADHLRFLKLLGIDRTALSEAAQEAVKRLEFLPQPGTPAPRESPSEKTPATGPKTTPALAAKAGSLAELAELAADCRGCTLCLNRNNVVMGEGDPEARLVFIGEGPGHDEDRAGRPFIGPAGKLLTKIIQAMGLSREEVFITNVVKCRPPRNRNPKPEEAEICRGWLDPQLEFIRPQMIVALGRIAAQALLRTEEPISALRGSFRDLDGIPVMPTFHPSYLLRQGHDRQAKGQVWADMKKVLTEMGLEVPG